MICKFQSIFMANKNKTKLVGAYIFTTKLKRKRHLVSLPLHIQARTDASYAAAQVVHTSVLYLFHEEDPLGFDKPPKKGLTLVQIFHWSFAEVASSWIQSWQLLQRAGDASKQAKLGHSAPKWLPSRLFQLFITASAASSQLLWKGNRFHHSFS